MIGLWAFIRAVPWWVYPLIGLLGWTGESRLEVSLLKHQLNALKLSDAKEKADALAAQQAAYAAQLAVVNSAQSVLSTANSNTSTLRTDVTKRLRDAADSVPAASTSILACRSDPTPAAVLSDATRNDLVALAADADQLRNNYLACQAILKGANK